MNRDINNNLLSISSSKYSPNSSDSYIEVSSSTQYKLDPHLIDFEFQEFTDNVINNINNLPDYLIIVTKSDYYDLQNQVLNLEDELSVSKSIFDIEKQSLLSQNDALFKTIESVHKTAKNVVDSLLLKYTNNNVFQDINNLYYIYSSSFDYIIENSSSLFNRHKTITAREFVQLPGAPSGTFMSIDTNEIIYNLQFNDNFLDIYGGITSGSDAFGVKNKYEQTFKIARESFDNIILKIKQDEFNYINSGTDINDKNSTYILQDIIIDNLYQMVNDMILGILSPINYNTLETDLRNKYETILADTRTATRTTSYAILDLKLIDNMIRDPYYEDKPPYYYKLNKSDFDYIISLITSNKNILVSPK